MSEPAVRGWQRPSIYDVARSAGVSHMTVSRVLNEHPNIREATRQRVLHAIAELGYTRSSIARSLAMRRTMRIGVIVDSPVQYGPNSTLRALETAAREAGYGTSAISISDGENEQIECAFGEMVTQGVDALCVIAPRDSSLSLFRARTAGLPILVVKSEPEDLLYTAGVDQQAGAIAAVDHLIELGHRSIAHLAGPLDWYDARAREHAWREALETAGLPVLPAIPGDWTADRGYEVGTTHDFAGATAVFAANDQMALGLIHGLADRGLRVPEDISVVGFDDLPDARHFLPPLTTVRQDFSALGDLVMDRIGAALRGDAATGPVDIEPRLIVRASTAPLRPSESAELSRPS